jgi:hypothetical protein
MLRLAVTEALSNGASIPVGAAVVHKVHITGRKKYRRSPINGFIGFIGKFLSQK